MDWDKLKIFHAVAAAGNFTKATYVLNLSQSAISRQIQSLEQELKTQLFERHARGLSLTENGEYLFKTAHEVISKLKDVESTLIDKKNKPSGKLTVTTVVSFGTTWLTPRIQEFMKLNPEIEIELIQYYYNEIIITKYTSLYARLSDKFGDSGITNAFIIEKNDKEWRIDTFLLSCRIIGRGIEDAIISYILKEAKNQGVEKIRADFIPTKKNFKGDITIVLFNIIKLISNKDRSNLGQNIGNEIVKKSDIIDEFNLVQGFLNLSISDTFYIDFLQSAIKNDSFFNIEPTKGSNTFMVEYSSPNTNKPLHLGHIRNNLLGYSISRILEANGKKVIKTQIINDRGIHICKCIVAWKLYGKDSTPESSGLKGDKLVGNYYVLFETKHKEEVDELIKKGVDKEEAINQSNVMKLAKETLKKWENDVLLLSTF